MDAKKRKVAKVKTPNDYTMKYAGQNPLAKLRDGEPYFFLRAQDKLSTRLVSLYADMLKSESENAYSRGETDLSDRLLKQALGVLKVAGIFAGWQMDNSEFVKLPD